MHMLRLLCIQGSVVVWFGDLVSPFTIHVWGARRDKLLIFLRRICSAK